MKAPGSNPIKDIQYSFTELDNNQSELKIYYLINSIRFDIRFSEFINVYIYTPDDIICSGFHVNEYEPANKYESTNVVTSDPFKSYIITLTSPEVGTSKEILVTGLNGLG